MDISESDRFEMVEHLFTVAKKYAPDMEIPNKIFYETICPYTLAEIIISKTTQLAITRSSGYDFTDLSDCKVALAQYRSTSYCRYMTFSVKIKNTSNKIGWLRIIAYDNYNKKFTYYMIPKMAYRNNPVEITLQSYSSHSAPTTPGSNYQTWRKWHNYQVPEEVFFTVQINNIFVSQSDYDLNPNHYEVLNTQPFTTVYLE